jgi:hypothetical protein
MLKYVYYRLRLHGVGKLLRQSLAGVSNMRALLVTTVLAAATLCAAEEVVIGEREFLQNGPFCGS